MSKFDELIDATHNLKTIRTKYWRELDENNRNNNIEKGYNDEVDKTYEKFEKEFEKIKESIDNNEFPSFEYQSENDLVFITFKYENAMLKV